MKSLIVASLLLSQPVQILPDFGASPTVDLSAIRSLVCDKGMGTGFLIADDTIATALHVSAAGHCKDGATGKPTVTYYKDPVHDFALMKVDLKGIPYLKYDCSRYVTGKHYASYGYSPYLQNYDIFRQSDMIAYADYSGPDYVVGGTHFDHMRHLFGASVPGHSGGPVIDTVTGNVVGVNNSGLVIAGLATGQSYSTELADTTLCDFTRQ